MKNSPHRLLLIIFVLFSTTVSSSNASPVTGSQAESVKVSDQDAVFLFRYVGGPFDGNLPEDLDNQILHSDLLMCSILFKTGNKIVARCLLPAEQIKIENDNATQVTKIMEKYSMPSHFKLGYQTFEAGLDCTNALSGKEYPKCFLTPQSPK